MIFADLPDIQKIDAYSRIQQSSRHWQLSDLFPNLPQFTITHPTKTTETDHKKVDKLIKEFTKKAKK
ncbi:MAG TPA: hypothetical protein ENH82_17490 [bacterium]|nr:hypothetical protein [bacterium]